MLNIEKYKNELSKVSDALDCQICVLRKKGNCKLGDHCDECRAENIKWLCSEYKEPILDEVEKAYLSAVIKPFKKHVKTIMKAKQVATLYAITIDIEEKYNYEQL